jgi:hypothetical protein
VLVGLYEEPERPPNAVEFLRKHMGSGADSDVDALRAEVDRLRVENERLRAELARLKADVRGGGLVGRSGVRRGGGARCERANCPRGPGASAGRVGGRLW